MPSRVGPLAKNLIQKLLQHEPNKRPSVAEILQVRIESGILIYMIIMTILQDDFMTMGYLPPRLPVSCLTMAPR